MICALAASVSGACIPFGAAHRVYFDTSPLKGNCPDTLVSRQLLLKIRGVRVSGLWADTGDVEL